MAAKALVFTGEGLSGKSLLIYDSNSENFDCKSVSGKLDLTVTKGDEDNANNVMISITKSDTKEVVYSFSINQINSIIDDSGTDIFDNTGVVDVIKQLSSVLPSDVVSTGSSTRSYKVYTAILSQSGTSAPTAIELENTLGVTITWARSSAGFYSATASAAAFTNNKTVVFFEADWAHAKVSGANRDSDTNLNIFTGSDYITGADGFSKASIEIRVYN